MSVNGVGRADERVFRRWLSPRQADWLLCTAVVVTGAVQLGLTWTDPVSRLVVSTTLIPACSIPLLFRRRYPGLVLVLAGVTFGVLAVAGRLAAGLVGLQAAGYAAALYGPRWLRTLGGAVAAGLLLLSFTAALDADQGRTLARPFTLVLSYCAAWICGEYSRVRRAYLAEVEDRARRLEQQRDEHALHAAAVERNRIAREVHDVVTHHVSMIAVQAGAARRTGERHPERALATLAVIESAAHHALAELRAQLGVLRHANEQPPPRQPSPTLAQLDELVATAREGGMDVTVRVEGTPVPLGALLELCAYRVVQEALTNTVKHAPHSQATVLVRYGEYCLQLVVVDDGPGPPAHPVSGFGLIGMRERVTLAGGQFHAGPAPGGGYRVEVLLPLPEAPTADLDIGRPGEPT